MSIGSANYATAVIGLSVCELHVSYVLASAASQPPTFAEA
jgi:hypothetical protein